MLIELVTGERRSAVNVLSDARGGSFSELVVNDVGLGRYFEMVRYGRVFTTMIKAVTIAATHNSPIAAATATPVIALLNPISSGKAFSLVRIVCSTVSGTPAGGQFVLNTLTPTTLPTTSNAGSIFSHLLSNTGASPQGSVGRTWHNTALTGILPVVSNEISIIGAASAAAAAGNGGPGITGEDIGGLFIVPPGVLLAIMAGSGAGTSWIVNVAVTWVEIDWPL